MSEWKKYKLGDIAKFINGRAYKATEFLESGTPIIRIQNLTGEGNKVYSNLKLPPDKYIEHGDLVYAWSATFGPYLWKGKRSIYHYHIWKIECLCVDKKFLYYHLLNVSDSLKDFGNGTLFVHITKGLMESFEILLPPEKEQKAIADVLSSLDDKIDLLHRQNKTLESMAETLFRQWFVVEAQDDWESVELGNFIEVMRGLSYKGAGLCSEGNGVPMHNLNSVYEGGGYKYGGIKFYSGEFKDRHLVHHGDVIITNTEQGHELLLIGCPAIVPRFFGESGIFSQHIFKLRIKDEHITEPFLYHLIMSYDVREQIGGSANGSTVNMLPKDGIELAKFKLPPKNKISDFTTTVKPFLEKKELIHYQIQTLENLRDTLLPKLMSGEVRVNYTEH